MKPWQAAVKKTIDLSISLFALILASPIFILIGIAVRLSSPGPIIYCQKRLGKGGVPFTLYKFRSLYQDSHIIRTFDGSNVVMKGDARLTSMGHLLRSFSLDELPQFINVLKGDMSLVGPRPDLLECLCHYTAEEHRKLELKPGLTGLAMIRGRNLIPWKERIRLDIWYIEHYSLWLDLKIFLITVPTVLFRKGIYPPKDLHNSTIH